MQLLRDRLHLGLPDQRNPLYRGNPLQYLNRARHSKLLKGPLRPENWRAGAKEALLLSHLPATILPGRELQDQVLALTNLRGSNPLI